MTRAILHVDMDAFYASVEQRDNPQLKGKPVIVGGTGNRGVVAAASYEVRAFGVHSAMPMREALQRCPQAICISPRIKHYQSVSKEIFAIFHEYTPLVEGLSLDEAFLDVTHSQSAFGSAEQIAVEIKSKIHARTQLTASVGVAPNKLIAKIASDLRKPDGLMMVNEKDIHAVLDPLPVSRLFGIGKKTVPRLHALNILTFSDLRHANEQQLKPLFGKYTAQVQARASGVDDRPVIADGDEKQISSEITFDTDIHLPSRIHAELSRLADRTASRLRAAQLQTSCVIVKIRRNDFTTFTRQQHIHPPTQETRVIDHTANELMEEWLRENAPVSLRLLGVGVSDLTEAAQLELFATPQSARNRELDAAVDRIREKFGSIALTRGDVLHQAAKPATKLNRK
ncbi:MAG TPA: DNA polymerase IV [Steroidobacteraceae bacterium]|nr:DNA polymerase IV [Steroidobacteraceae bacterium]